MSTDRKPRSDARLKTLPEDRQAEIASLLATKSIAEVRKELIKDGLNTSVGALSEFFSWWRLRESIRRRETRIQGILENVKLESAQTIPEDRLWELGQSLFGAMAIAEEDGKEWFRTQRLALARKKIGVEERRVAMLEAKLLQVQEAVTAARTGGLTPESLAKIEEAARLL